MRTIAVGVQNLMVPCGCACRYCLLFSNKTANGADYRRGRAVAERLAEWTKAEEGRPAFTSYTVAHCAEYGEICDNIAFNRHYGAYNAGLLQCNGINIRDEAETERFIEKIKAAGISTIDTTFFGDEFYHDKFAARQGDYDFMLRLMRKAVEHGIVCAPSIAVTEENKTMLSALIDTLEDIAGKGKVNAFLPDYRGRGYMMEDARLTAESYEALTKRVKDVLNLSRYETEKEWLTSPLPEYTRRVVEVTLRADNIEYIESLSPEELITYVEGLDDAYYRAIPSVNELAMMYGDISNARLYRPRDLYWKWQKRYIRERGLDIYNVTDERNCWTMRS